MVSQTVTRCSKPAGEYCRLHNPAPAASSFNSIQEVFTRVDAEELQRRSKPYTQPATGVSFQKITDVRRLPADVPVKLQDHITAGQESIAHLTPEGRIAVAGYASFAAGICNAVLLGKKYQYPEEAVAWKSSQGPLDFNSREELVDYIETLDSVLASRQKERRIIYRGIPIYTPLHDEIGASIGKELSGNDTDGLVEGLKEYYKPGKVFHNKTYLSTTQSAHYAAKRARNTAGTKESYFSPSEIRGIVFELKTNAGLDIIGGVKPPYTHEREVALPRGTYFKVVDVHVRPEKYDTVSGYDIRRRPDDLVEDTYTDLAVVVQMVEVDSEGNEILDIQPHTPGVSAADAVSQV